MRRIIIAITIGLALAAVVALSFLSYKNTETEGGSVVSLPSDATILIDGRTIKSGEYLDLKPGDYELEVSRDGFEKQTQTITIDDSNEPYFVALTPNSDTGHDWLRDNQDAALSFEYKSGQSAARQGDEFRKKHDIVNHLPVNSMLFSVGYYENDDSDDITITIRTAPVYIQNAVNYMRSLGYNLEEYKVEIVGVQNEL